MGKEETVTKFQRRKLTLQFCLALAILVLWGCQSRSAPSPRQPAAVPVVVAAAVQKPVAIQVSRIGNVQPYSSIAVKAQIGGELTGVYFTQGQFVRKGDLLFQIDPRPYEQALRQAQATLARDIAQVNQAKANLVRDLAQAKNARTEADRYATLARQGIISTEQNDERQTSSAAFQASVDADRAAIESSEAAVASDKAAVENARLNLTYCQIRSPIDGVTGDLLVTQGNLVKANADTPLITINQISPIYVAFSVPQKQLPEIRRYMAERQLAVEATPTNNPEQRQRGVLTFVNNTVDTNTGTIELKATFDNRAKHLWPGAFVDVVLTLATRNDAIVVPSEAIQTGQQGQYAFVVKPDHTVESRAVKTGQILGREAVVDAGIRPGELVVTDGQLRLVPGAQVQIQSGAPRGS